MPTNDEQDRLLTEKLDEWEASGRTLTPESLAPNDLLLRGLLREAIQSRRSIAAAVRYQHDTQPGVARPLNRLEPGSEIGGYRIEQFIASSGSAHVYRATQLSTDRNVAIKLLKPTPDPTVRDARLIHEARMIGKLSHPNIAAVYDAGSVTVDGIDQPFLAMEWIEGQSLRQALPRLQQLPVKQRIDLFEQVGTALSYAHSKLVLHLDIKPENVLVDESLVIARLVDFGIGNRLDASESAPPRPSGSGTPRYMSPEQYKGDVTSLDVRTDVWGLGMLLYELLSGTHPMDGLSREAVAERSKQASWTPPAMPGVTQELNAIVRRCLAILPDGRYATVASLLSDLSGWRSHRPITAIPTSTLRRGRLFIRRNWIAVGASMIAAALLSGYLVQTTLARRESEQLRTIAVRERDTAIQERERADRARTDADINARRAEAMNSLFTEATAAVSSDEGGKPNITVRDVYLRMIKGTKDRFPDDPLIRSLVLNRAGNALADLGDLQSASSALRESYLIAKSLPEADIKVLSQTASSYLFALCELDQSSEAKSLYAEVLASSIASSADPAVLVSRVEMLANLSSLLIRIDQRGEAEQRIAEALSLCDRLGTSADRYRADLVSRLALMRYSEGKAEEALKLFEQAEGVYFRTQGPGSATGIATMRSRAMMLGPLGRGEEAVALMRRVVELRSEYSGPDHSDTASALLGLATNLIETGKLAEAIPVYERAVALFQATRGLTFRDTLLAMNNLAGAYDKADRIEDAVRLSKQVYYAVDGSGQSPAMKALLASRYPRMLTKAKRYEEALPILLKTLSDLDAAGQSGHDITKAILADAMTSAHAVNDMDVLKTLEQRTAKPTTAPAPTHVVPMSPTTQPATQPATSPEK